MRQPAVGAVDQLVQSLAKEIAATLLKDEDFFEKLGERLERRVEDAVDEAVGDLKPNAEDIDGLDDAVKEIVRNMSFTVDVDD